MACPREIAFFCSFTTLFFHCFLSRLKAKKSVMQSVAHHSQVLLFIYSILLIVVRIIRITLLIFNKCALQMCLHFIFLMITELKCRECRRAPDPLP